MIYTGIIWPSETDVKEITEALILAMGFLMIVVL